MYSAYKEQLTTAVNDVQSSITKLSEINFNSCWSGDAKDAQIEKLDALLKSLNTQLSYVNKLVAAMGVCDIYDKCEENLEIYQQQLNNTDYDNFNKRNALQGYINNITTNMSSYKNSINTALSQCSENYETKYSIIEFDDILDTKSIIDDLDDLTNSFNLDSIVPPYVPEGTSSDSNGNNTSSSDNSNNNQSNGNSGSSPREGSSQQGGTPPNGNYDVNNYSGNSSGFKVTTDNTTYSLSQDDIDLLSAIVSAESDGSYDDALAVASVIFNRCDAPNWVASYGTDPVKQATAPNQFVVYQGGNYKKYMPSNGGPKDTCLQAVLACANGVRNCEYLSFRSNGSTGYSSNMITPTGNRYK